MPEAGLRALELERDSGWIAFPHLTAQWLCVIRLISITVAGAAPALDESAPDFPFTAPTSRGHSLLPHALERSPHAARSLPAADSRRQEPPGEISPVA